LNRLYVSSEEVEKSVEPHTSAHSTRAKQIAFLEAFSQFGTIAGVSRLANVGRRTHYDWIQQDAAYNEAFSEATEQYADAVRDEVRRRAIEGYLEPVIYQGAIAKDERGRPLMLRKFSDRLLELLAKAKCPEFREKHEVAGVGAGSIAIHVVTGVPQPNVPSSGIAPEGGGMHIRRARES
jgi:hypothetical protein